MEWDNKRLQKFLQRNFNDETSYNRREPRLPVELKSKVFNESQLMALAELFVLWGNDIESFQEIVPFLEVGDYEPLRWIDGYHSYVSFSKTQAQHLKL